MIFNFFNKSKQKHNEEIIFLHVPKTGGSTFVGLLKDSIKIKKEEENIPSHIIDQIGNVQVKHIDFSTEERKFQYPELFDGEKNISLNPEHIIFMLIRNPVDRMISEFNFQYHMLKGKDGNKNAAIISKLKPMPNTLEDYIKSPHTQNYQVKFLLGRKIADPRPVTKDEYNRISNGIEQMQIHCGLTEEYSKFLNTFQNKTGLKLKKNMVVRKKTPSSLKANVTQELKDEIIQLNKFDQMLYELVKNKINRDDSSFATTYNYKDDAGFVV